MLFSFVRIFIEGVVLLVQFLTSLPLRVPQYCTTIWYLFFTTLFVFHLKKILNVFSINHDLEKHCVISDICEIIQLRQGAEGRAATGDIHFSFWSLKRIATWVGSKGVDHVFNVILIKQHERDLLSEWPAE